MFKRLLRIVLLSGLVGVGGTILVAFGLVLTQQPPASVAVATTGFDFLSLPPVVGLEPLRPYPVRSQEFLQVRHYTVAANQRTEAVPLLVLVHGSGWHSAQFHSLARRITQAGLADVLVPDLRGHGPAPSRRGDVDYIGQLEDDLADLLQVYRREGQPIVMLGHSSGGGLVVRFAGGGHGHLLDGAVLLAPFLQHDAPTTRQQSGGWAHPLLRRIIGQTILQKFGIRALENEVAVQFAFPQQVLDGPLGHTATPAYSYRMMTSFAPRRDYLADVSELPAFLLIAGAQDEAFVAEAYEPLLKTATAAGQYHVLPGVSHLGVVDAPATLALLSDWLTKGMGLAQDKASH